MAAGTLVSVEEYLKTIYRPDCDYIDGEVVERHVGEFGHAQLQLDVGSWLRSRKTQFRIKVGVEARLRVAQGRYRIPDVVVLSADAPYERVIVTPPLLCIEILSSCDTLNQIWDRTKDYFAIGVPVCWIIDPESRRGWIATSESLVEAKDGILRAGEIEMPLADVLE